MFKYFMYMLSILLTMMLICVNLDLIRASTTRFMIGGEPEMWIKFQRQYEESVKPKPFRW